MESFLAGNPYFSAGFGLIGVTAALAVLRKGAVHGVTFARRRMLVSLEIPSKDHSYEWFLQWMAARNAQRASAGIDGASPASAAASASAASGGLIARLLSGQASHQLSVETSFVRHDNGSTLTNFALVPGPGTHYFNYKGAWFMAERQRERTMIDLKSGSPWETVTITTLSRDRPLLVDMLQEAKAMALAKEVGKTVIYTSYGPEWRPFGNPRERRPLESVVLDGSISDTIQADVKAFLSGGAWYHDRGIPYRRGYLLYGPPGSGKTSFIQALAGNLGYNICVLNLAERGMTDDRLAHLLNNIPMRSIILLEDIDAAFPDRDVTPEDGLAGAGAAAALAATHARQGITSMLTFSGLLNALDGVAASEERLVFMTTNHIKRLDAALIRPGRVDMRVYIGNATQTQARAMFLRFYPGETALADTFVAKLSEHGLLGRLSPALLQGHFVVHRDSAAAAVDALASLLPSVHPHQ
ncbi:BCS1 N terminal-domain-containing protein [Entophlyctis helioformis]|nr:BCS1 N terminal-domain-containing protein [Entophlyctis helioformis]